MDHITSTLTDGLGAAAASSGILTQLQANIFGLLYLQAEPLSLDDIALELDQSKSNISLNVRVLVDWHLVRRKRIPGSRRDHYEAATDFFRAMQEIFERRFRWTVRQVLAAVEETKATAEQEPAADRGGRARYTEMKERLDQLERFFTLLDAGIGAFVAGEPFPADSLRNVVSLAAGRMRRNR